MTYSKVGEKMLLHCRESWQEVTWRNHTVSWPDWTYYEHRIPLIIAERLRRGISDSCLGSTLATKALVQIILHYSPAASHALWPFCDIAMLPSSCISQLVDPSWAYPSTSTYDASSGCSGTTLQPHMGPTCVGAFSPFRHSSFGRHGYILIDIPSFIVLRFAVPHSAPP